MWNKRESKEKRQKQVGKKSQRRCQMWWCRQEERQNENAHFWRDLSLAVLGLTFSLYLFFQVYTIWPKCSWWADVTMWGVMTLEGATHLKLIGPPSYNLNSYKRLLTGGPLFLQKVIWPFMCTVVRRAHFFFYAIFHLFLSYVPKPNLNLPTQPPFHLIWKRI